MESEYLKGTFLEIQCCPYCKATLIRRKDFLICRFHRWAYPIIKEKTVDFRQESIIKNINLDS